MSRRANNKNKFSSINCHKYQSIEKYVNDITEWRLWPSSIRDGIVYIIFHGHEVEYSEFMKLQPQPIVMNFNSDHSNVDKTKAFML